MKLFDKEKAALLRQQNKTALWTVGISLAVTVSVCLACILRVTQWGRPLCQLVATAATAVFGCLSLVQAQNMGHRSRVIALCERMPATVCTGRVLQAASDPTTLGKLRFYGLDMEVDGKRRTFYLYHGEAAGPYVGKTVAVTAADRIIYSVEVVQ